MDPHRGADVNQHPPTAAPTDAPAIKRRAPIACRRCRRLRSKCLHDKATPPCKACKAAGIPAEECIFPVRGQPDVDRDYRHPRTRAAPSTAASSSSSRVSRKPNLHRSGSSTDLHQSPGAVEQLWDELPPLEDLIDGVNRFTGQYFQLGFLPKQRYPQRLREDSRSANIFLLLSILSISARLSPALTRRYGSGVEASRYFADRASDIAIGEVYEMPTLERCQAFYLLSIAQQGGGEVNKSYINMGISIRMAALMRLHREETYRIDNPTPEAVIRAESARRTLWMLHSQDSLHSGPSSPVSLAAADVTALLPCNEEDFAAGREPTSRAALQDTPPAIENPSLIRDPARSLFASLMQAHHFWGIVSRRAVSLYSHSSRPWEEGSEFARMVARLREWEAELPREHMWSVYLLQKYRTQSKELAYLSMTMMTRLCNIVIRRPYLTNIIKLDSHNRANTSFFSDLSLELFRNVSGLFEQIDAHFASRAADDSVGAQIAAFCVYSCGLFSAYLCKYPNICPDQAIARVGPAMLQRTIAILTECKEVWPLAARWVDALERYSRDPQSATLTNQESMADGKDPIPQALPPLHPDPSTARRRQQQQQQGDGAAPAGTTPSSARSKGPSQTKQAASQAQANLTQTSNSMAVDPPMDSPNDLGPVPKSDPMAMYPVRPYMGMSNFPPATTVPTSLPHNQTSPVPQQQQQQPHTLSPPNQFISNTTPPQQMYMGQRDGSGSGSGMLIDGFDTSAAQQYAQQQPNPAGSAYQPMDDGSAGGGGMAYFPPQLGPMTDGFEGELMSYIDGSMPWGGQGFGGPSGGWL